MRDQKGDRNFDVYLQLSWKDGFCQLILFLFSVQMQSPRTNHHAVLLLVKAVNIDEEAVTFKTFLFHSMCTLFSKCQVKLR